MRCWRYGRFAAVSSTLGIGAFLVGLFSAFAGGCDGGASPSPEPACVTDADCPTNSFCEADGCVTANDAKELHATLGFIEQNAFVTVQPGGNIHLYVGFQGASHILAAMTLIGPPPTGEFRVSWTITDAADDSILSTSEARATVQVTAEPNISWMTNQLIVFASRATAIDGREVNIVMRLLDAVTGEPLVEVTQSMILVIRVS